MHTALYPSRHPILPSPAMLLLALITAGAPLLTAAETAPAAAGLAVVIGVPNDALLRELVDDGRRGVQCVVAGADDAARLQKRIAGLGMDGFATVARLREGRLGHPDNSVDLVVLTGTPTVTEDEALRITAPLGSLRIAGRSVRKPWPETMATVPSISNRQSVPSFFPDRALRVPGEIAWMSGPRWGEGPAVAPIGQIAVAGVHVVGSVVGMSARGLKQARNQGDRYVLTARNAFDGVILWDRPINRAATFVADQNSLYLLDAGRLAALDLRSGVERWTVDAAITRPKSLLKAGPVVVLPGEAAVVAYDAATGAERWRIAGNGAGTIGDDRAVFLSVDRDRKPVRMAVRPADGTELWRRTAAELGGSDKGSPGWACLTGDLVGLNDDSVFIALDARTGATRWTTPFAFPVTRPVKRLPIRLEEGSIQLGERAYRLTDGTAVDPGAALRDEACSPTLTTPTLLVDSRLTARNLAGEVLAKSPGSRLPCRTGGLIAHGLLFGSPTDCVCNPDQIHAYVALGNPRGAFDEALFKSPFITERGPGHPAATAATDGWTTYGGGPGRDFTTDKVLDPGLRLRWRTALTGPRRGPMALSWQGSGSNGLTPPVAGGGLVVVGDVEGQTVHAVDAATGERRWSFTAEGRVTIPPTLHDGRWLVGSHDGRVHALSPDNGAPIWSTRIAPDDRRLAAYGQWESPWPVTSGVLVVDGTAYAVAGLSTAMHGGLIVAALDPATGSRRWTRRLTAGSRSWTNGLNHILQSDGRHAFLGATCLVPDGTQPVPTPTRPFVNFPRLGAVDSTRTMKAFDSWRSQFITSGLGELIGRHVAREGDQVLLVGALALGKGRAQIDRHSIALHDAGSPSPQWEVAVPAERAFLAAALTPRQAVAALGVVVDNRVVASEILLLDRTSGKTMSTLSLPDEEIVSTGLAIHAGRIHVACRSGALATFAP